MTSHPYGYAGEWLTIEQCEQKLTIRNLNFEFWRRVKAMMQEAARQGMGLGIGGGWRIQPANRPGHASPGNSNHEGFPADGRSGGAVAADMVTPNALPWMEVNCSRFGLRTFTHVNNEPWHVQPKEIPASRNWRTNPWVLQAWPLDVPPANQTLAALGIIPEQNKYGLYPYQSWRDKPGVLTGMGENDLRPNPNTGYILYAQAVLRYKMGYTSFSIDGMWGQVSSLYLAARIIDWNRFTGDNLYHNNGNLGLDQWRFVDGWAKDWQNLIP